LSYFFFVKEFVSRHFNKLKEIKGYKRRFSEKHNRIG